MVEDSGIVLLMNDEDNGEVPCAPMYMRRCPGPRDRSVNPKCRKIVTHTTKYELHRAEKRRKACESCAHFNPSREEYKIRDISYIRKCPNPQENQRCKQEMYYKNEVMKNLADENESTCTSCRSFQRRYSEEIRKRMSSAQRKSAIDPKNREKKGHPMTEEHRKRLLNLSLGRKHTEKTKKTMSETRKEKFADPEQLAKLLSALHSQEARKKRIQSYREHNKRFGPPKPPTNGFAISGWYSGLHFRSSCELNFLLHYQDIPLISAETKEFRIPYIDEHGVEQNYYPDFFYNNKLYEIKALDWYRIPDKRAQIELKKVAGEKFCQENGFEYVFLPIKGIQKTKVFELREQGIVKLDDKREKQYQAWLMKKTTE